MVSNKPFLIAETNNAKDINNVYIKYEIDKVLNPKMNILNGIDWIMCTRSKATIRGALCIIALLFAYVVFKQLIAVLELPNIPKVETDININGNDSKSDVNKNIIDTIEFLHSEVKDKLDKDEIENATTFSKWCKDHLADCPDTVYSDKHAIKQLLPTIAPGLGFAEEYAYVSSAAEITEELLAKLPSSYIVKTNNQASSLGVVKVQDGKLDCMKDAYCKKIQHKNMSLTSRLHEFCSHHLPRAYKGPGWPCLAKIPHLCMFEQLLKVDKVSDVQDYKVFVFHGRPMFVQIFTDRMKVMKVNYRTLSWVEINMHDRGVPHKQPQDRANLPEKPPHFLHEMVQYSAQIGKLFKAIRIDFFVFGDEYKFAEITIFHSSCLFGMRPEITDHFYGYLIENPQISVDSDYVLQLTNQTGFL